MVINDLLPDLPGGSMQRTKTEFELLNSLLYDEKNPVNVDIGALVHICALTHRSTHNYGTLLTSVHGWKINCVLWRTTPWEKARACTT